MNGHQGDHGNATHEHPEYAEEIHEHLEYAEEEHEHLELQRGLRALREQLGIALDRIEALETELEDIRAGITWELRRRLPRAVEFLQQQCQR